MGLDKIKVMSNHGNPETLAGVGVQLLPAFWLYIMHVFKLLCIQKTAYAYVFRSLYTADHTSMIVHASTHMQAFICQVVPARMGVGASTGGGLLCIYYLHKPAGHFLKSQDKNTARKKSGKPRNI